MTLQANLCHPTVALDGVLVLRSNARSLVDELTNEALPLVLLPGDGVD